MPQSTRATVQLGTYNPLTDVFTSVLDLNDDANIWQLSNSPEFEALEKQVQRAGNPRSDGERITNAVYKNRLVSMRMHVGKAATYATIRGLISIFVGLVEGPNLVIRYAPPSPNVNVNYSYLDVVNVEHNADKFSPLRVVNGTTRIVAVFECAPYFRGDRLTLQNLVMSPGFEAPMGGGIVMGAVTGFFDPFTNINAYTTIAGSPSVASNLLTLPSGAEVSFGSPAWGPVNQWIIRFQFATGLTAVFNLHRTDASNRLAAQVDANLYIVHRVAATDHIIATTGVTLTNGNFYWMRVRQYPALAGSAPYIEATLFNDTGPGSIGTQVAAVGPVTAFDGVTALVGKPTIFAVSATLKVGGNFASVHYLQLFGPGGWLFTGALGGPTATCSGAWDGVRGELGMSGSASAGTQTSPNGPVTSFGSARIDCAPAGTISANWSTYQGGAPAGTPAMAVRTVGDTINAAAACKSSGLGSGATIKLNVEEYNSSGVQQRSTTLQTLTGNQASWTTLSGSVVTGANCAYTNVVLALADTSAGASANGTVWFDNAQCWNSSATGMASMPYCELRFPNSPAQTLLSGLLGDVPCPAAYYVGTWSGVTLGAGATLPFYIGWRAKAGATACLVGARASTAAPPLIDGASWGGYVSAANLNGPLNGLNSANSTLGDMVGTYRPLMRVKTTQSAGNLPFTTVQANAYWKASGAPTLGQAFGRLISPAYSAASAFQVTDAGLSSLPPFPVSAAHDLSTMNGAIAVEMQDPNIGASTITWNWEALIPADGDGSLVTGMITWASTAGAPTVVQLVIDGLNAQHQRDDINVTALMYYSTTFTAQLRPDQSVFGAGIAGAAGAGGRFGVMLSQDSVPQLDPTVKVGATSGVNQGVALLTDATATIYPLSLDIVYTPLYLYPRS